MDDIFTGKADLSGMLAHRDEIKKKVPIYISAITQKAVIDVNEEGATAAAVTGKIYI